MYVCIYIYDIYIYIYICYPLVYIIQYIYIYIYMLSLGIYNTHMYVSLRVPISGLIQRGSPILTNAHIHFCVRVCVCAMVKL